MGRICLFVKYKLRSFGCASCSLKGVFTSIPHTDSKPLECQWDILLTSRGSDGLEMGCHWQHIHHHTSRSILSGFVNFLFNQPFAFPGAEPYSISRYAVAGLVLGLGTRFQRHRSSRIQRPHTILHLSKADLFAFPTAIQILLSQECMRYDVFVIGTRMPLSASDKDKHHGT